MIDPPVRIALFAATSGHSGVDRVFANLASRFVEWGHPVDLLRIAHHGPYLEAALPGLRVVELGTRHVNSSLVPLVRYLRSARPAGLLCDKDRVNRLAIVARGVAGVDTRLAVRLGTTVSVNLGDRSPFARWTQRASIRWLYPHADVVIVPSHGVAEDLARYTGLDPARIAVVRSPIVTARLAARAADPAAHPWLTARDRPVILGVGELSARKDFETLVRAFARVQASLPSRLLILGEGRRRESLRALAEELGVGAEVDLPGFAANPYASMARADVFVLSSRWEGMPVALIEALATHTPVVSTDCPSGPREVLDGGRYGALVPVGDDLAMAEAILRTLRAETPRPDFDAAVSDYRDDRSAAAYLEALGLARGRA